MAHPELNAVARQYLEHVRVEKRLSARTLALYTLDLERLTTLAVTIQVPLLQLRGSLLYLSVLDYPSGWRIAAPSRTVIPELKARWPSTDAVEVSDRTVRKNSSTPIPASTSWA